MRLPQPLVSGTKRAEYLNQLRAVVKSLLPVASVGARVVRRSVGTSYVAKRPRPAQSSGGMTFRGEYNGGPYSAQDVVVVRGGGPSAGAYVAARDVPEGNPPAYPDIGIYWVSLKGSEVIYWT